MKNNLFKIFTALLISTYVFSTVGFSVIEHYCGGELEDVAIFSKPKSCCGGDEDISEDGCCKNKESHIAFHKDFTFKVFTKKITEQKFSEPESLFPVLNFEKLKTSFSSSYILFPLKIPPLKLIQQFIVECSVMRI